MQLKMYNLIGFDKFYNTIKTQNLPVKTGYKLAKINELVSKELNFYTEKLSEIIKSNALYEDGELKYNEDRTQILIQEDKIDECNLQLNELNTLEILLDVENYLLNIEELDTLQCSVQELQTLMPFIK